MVEQVFQNLKDKNYEALYDTLPAGTRSRIVTRAIRERPAPHAGRLRSEPDGDRKSKGVREISPSLIPSSTAGC